MYVPFFRSTMLQSLSEIHSRVSVSREVTRAKQRDWNISSTERTSCLATLPLRVLPSIAKLLLMLSHSPSRSDYPETKDWPVAVYVQSKLALSTWVTLGHLNFGRLACSNFLAPKPRSRSWKFPTLLKCKFLNASPEDKFSSSINACCSCVGKNSFKTPFEWAICSQRRNPVLEKLLDSHNPREKNPGAYRRPDISSLYKSLSVHPAPSPQRCKQSIKKHHDSIHLTNDEITCLSHWLGKKWVAPNKVYYF